MKTSIEFLNHASVVISNTTDSILCDPWYEGDVFEKGWNLLYENDPQIISSKLEFVTHIWLSHEHPDHFSVPFFKRYKDIIQRKHIIILFQKRKDGRVRNFLQSHGFLVQELLIDQKTRISVSTSITCFKEGIYDSGILIDSENERILNINDCDITEEREVNRVLKVIGNKPVDVLLTQFSYAGWKGGKENQKWRQEASAEKIHTIKLQISTFKPSYIIPFASFSYFSNELNFYLNDSVNTPSSIYDALQSQPCKVLIMSPYDRFDGIYSESKSRDSIIFWKEQYQSLSRRVLNRHEAVPFETLEDSFKKYIGRVRKNNSFIFIKILKAISPLNIFRDLYVFVPDYDYCLEIDICSTQLKKSKFQPDLAINSGMLNFIFRFNYGFDTLTVNGCFEELNPGGFIRASKTLGIELLNNMGLYIGPRFFLSPNVFLFIFKVMRRVRGKLSS